MIVHRPTQTSFNTQKEAKNYFGNHRYRRLVRENKIYFTNYNEPVANDGTIIQENHREHSR